METLNLIFVISQLHFGIICESDAAEEPDLFGTIADAYMKVGLWRDAIETFSPLTRNEEVRLSSHD